MLISGLVVIGLPNRIYNIRYRVVMIVGGSDLRNRLRDAPVDVACRDHTIPESS